METKQKCGAVEKPFIHGSYLQGMETLQRGHVTWRQPLYTDPTYKEWKPPTHHHNTPAPKRHGSYLQGMETPLRTPAAATAGATRILPTRNGNSNLSQLGVVPQYTDPTYKEWKLWLRHTYIMWDKKHGSYLQGMETFFVN